MNTGENQPTTEAGTEIMMRLPEQLFHQKSVYKKKTETPFAHGQKVLI
jgi:hypothetical protein